LKIVAALAACACIASGTIVNAEDGPKGTVIMAKAAPKALLIWNASPAVADLVTGNQLGDDGLRELESDGVGILANRASSLKATRMELRIIYEQSGAVSPVYGTATFAGYEHVLTLVAARADIERNAEEWMKEISGGTAPRGLDIVVTGKLPPPQ
jgi:hypothetical protein